MEWQPIDTAPRDATEVWIGAPGKVSLGYLSMGSKWKSSWTGDPFAWEPTHWQPFHQPSPPIQQAKSEVEG